MIKKYESDLKVSEEESYTYLRELQHEKLMSVKEY